MTAGLLAAVPVKDLVNAKQRLVPALSPRERRELARAMLEDVLDALVAALPGSVFVVTTDPDVQALVRAGGAECLTESANRGHTAAVAFAQREAAARGVTRFLTLPGDVPCVTPGEISAVCRTLDEEPGAVFVPSRSGLGTNAVLLTPADAIPLTFGEPSFANHLATARSAGLTPRVLRLPGLGLDIDAPEDLRLLLTQGPDTRSARLLRGFTPDARPAGTR